MTTSVHETVVREEGCKRGRDALLWYMVFLNRLKPSLSISPLMSTTSTLVSLSAYFSRAKSSIRSAMSPVPPATSMHRRGPRAPGLSRDTYSSFHSRCTPMDIASFMRSYEDATLSNTFRTSDSFDSSGTVWNPKCVVRCWSKFTFEPEVELEDDAAGAFWWLCRAAARILG